MFLYRQRLSIAPNKDAVRKIITQIRRIGEAEIKNAEQTIPLVQADSRLGWEPSMEYIGSEYHLRWKIRQVRQVLDNEIPRNTWDIQYILDKDGKYEV